MTLLDLAEDRAEARQQIVDCKKSLRKLRWMANAEFAASAASMAVSIYCFQQGGYIASVLNFIACLIGLLALARSKRAILLTIKQLELLSIMLSVLNERLDAAISIEDVK